MKSPAVQTAGYFFIFVPPFILALGLVIGHHYLLGGFFFLILPFSRTVFGAASDSSVDYSDLQSNLLYHLPDVYALLVIPFVACFPFAIVGAQLGTLSIISLTFSTIVLFGLASCVSHALIHQSLWHRRLGSVLAAVCAYPWMQYEHLSHHARSRATDQASSPRHGESGVVFALRRLYIVPKVCFRFRHSASGRHAVKHLLDEVYTHLVISCATLAFFAWIGGQQAFWLYVVALIVTPMLISLVNYMQHWGLGDDLQAAGSTVRHAAWDDDCQVLTWLTLDLNFHFNHHQHPSSAYFRRSGKDVGVRMPLSYGFAIILCLFPRAWRRVMQPRLDAWSSDPSSVQSAGRRLFCFSRPSSDGLSPIR